MNQNELRVGVYVYEPREKKVVKINNSNAWRIAEDYMDFDPIPLTEEWLVRFGFEEIIRLDYKSGEYSKWVNYLGILISIPNFHLQIEDDKDLIYIRKIKYVHELQNLYFALTGEELELK